MSFTRVFTSPTVVNSEAQSPIRRAILAGLLDTGVRGLPVASLGVRPGAVRRSPGAHRPCSGDCRGLTRFRAGASAGLPPRGNRGVRLARGDFGFVATRWPWAAVQGQLRPAPDRHRDDLENGGALINDPLRRRRRVSVTRCIRLAGRRSAGSIRGSYQRAGQTASRAPSSASIGQVSEADLNEREPKEASDFVGQLWMGQAAAHKI